MSTDQTKRSIVPSTVAERLMAMSLTTPASSVSSAIVSWYNQTTDAAVKTRSERT